MTEKTRIEKLAEVTSNAIQKATGYSWDEWVRSLDEAGAEVMSHKNITTLLKSKNISYWWQQKIASGYRLHKGLRGKGQSSNMFQAGVSKLFSLSRTEAWNFITAPETTEIWNRENLNQSKINVIKTGSHMRLPYRRQEWNKPAILQIRTIAKGNRSTIHLLLSGLESESERNRMKAYLKKLMEELLKLSLRLPKHWQ